MVLRGNNSEIKLRLVFGSNFHSNQLTNLETIIYDFWGSFAI